MRKFMMVAATIVVGTAVWVSAQAAGETGAAAGGPFKMFKVYTDAKAPDNHYIPSGWMGDYGDLKYNDKFLEKPHSGTTSIQIAFSNKATQGARWSGIYWQNPPNNWGTRPGGFDLTGAKKLTFWARGDKGGERIEEFKMGGITGEYADSDSAGIGTRIRFPCVDGLRRSSESRIAFSMAETIFFSQGVTLIVRASSSDTLATWFSAVGLP